MNEITKMKARYAQQIEDGKRIEAFTSTGEWQWFVKHVVQPTCEEYTERIMSGQIQSNKEDWITRGMVMGMKLVITTPSNFLDKATQAKTKAKELNDYERGTE